MAVELDDLRPAGTSAREPNCAHSRFGAAGNEAHFLNRRYGSADGFRNLHFDLSRRAEGRAELKLPANCVLNAGMVMAKKQRPPASDAVQKTVAVDID